VSGEIAVRPAMTPMDLISNANQAGASIEQMERLFDLQLRWEENEARKEFNAAFAEFKAEGVRIVKNKKVSFGTTNYTHAELGHICDTVIPLLSKYGLSHNWSTTQAGAAITVTCKVSHSRGHSESTSLTANPDESGGKNKIQAVGSAVSYLQRYSLLCALGLATNSQDDDGNLGQKTQKIQPADDDEHVKALRACVSLEGLQAEWAAIPNTVRPKYTDIKDEVKNRLMTKEGK
jgi:hypothetical protein